MKDTKYTPGPWTVQLDIEYSDDGTKYFSIIGPWPSYEFITGNATAADAALIAAAPELLAALIYLRDCIESGKDPAMGDVHRAIAKATGSGS
jgi:hypothetical protein